MSKKCDLYFCDAVKSDRIRLVKLFDKNFSYDSEKFYEGFLGVNVDRVKMVSVVSDLRRNGIVCFSVPVAYRDCEGISKEAAFDIAINHANVTGETVVVSMPYRQAPPVFWSFDLIAKNTEEEKSGGIIMIDKMDGHIWSLSEYEEYLYDYNNVL